LVETVFEPATRPWRGLGEIPNGALSLRPAWQAFDAEARFPLDQMPESSHPDCQAAAVLTGRLTPTECPAFGRRCRPEHPLGAPMVSAEGACAAYFHYRAPMEEG
jgi:hydrogenase expression/formation protein HypD